MKAGKLTAKQRLFVAEYLVDLNATAAAIRAGYSEKTADRIGPELLGKTCVADAIQEAMAAREKRTGVTADKVLADLETVKQACMRPRQDGAGIVHPMAALKALELQGKHLGLFKEKMELTGKDGGPLKATAEPVDWSTIDPIEAARVYQEFMVGS